MDLLCVVRPMGTPAEDYPEVCEFLAAGLSLKAKMAPPEEAPEEECAAAEAPSPRAPVALPQRAVNGRFVAKAG